MGHHIQLDDRFGHGLGVYVLKTILISSMNPHKIRCRAQWLRGRHPDSRLREPGFESYAAVLKPRASFFTLHCTSSLSCINEYLAIDSGGYVYAQPFAHEL